MKKALCAAGFSVVPSAGFFSGPASAAGQGCTAYGEAAPSHQPENKRDLLLHCTQEVKAA